MRDLLRMQRDVSCRIGVGEDAVMPPRPPAPGGARGRRVPGQAGKGGSYSCLG
jgi:hypothetical protein